MLAIFILNFLYLITVMTVLIVICQNVLPAKPYIRSRLIKLNNCGPVLSHFHLFQGVKKITF